MKPRGGGPIPWTRAGALTLSAAVMWAASACGFRYEGAGTPEAERGRTPELHTIPAMGETGPAILTRRGRSDLPVKARASSDPIPDTFGFGRPATDSDIRPLDIDVGPDGEGLPPGSGTAGAGAAIYALKCAHCHGMEGEGGVNDRLVRSADQSGGRTIGVYWPYATTIFDYTRRAMPYDSPGSLTDDEVYSLTAWLLFRNGIIPEDAVMDAGTLPRVVMPAADRFVPDDRERYTTVR